MIDVKTGKELTRRDFGKGIAAILAAGCAPTIVSGAMMRMTGARNAAVFGGTKKTPFLSFNEGKIAWLPSVGSSGSITIIGRKTASGIGSYVAGNTGTNGHWIPPSFISSAAVGERFVFEVFAGTNRYTVNGVDFSYDVTFDFGTDFCIGSYSSRVWTTLKNFKLYEYRTNVDGVEHRFIPYDLGLIMDGVTRYNSIEGSVSYGEE